MNDVDLEKAINDSGFPLQLGLQISAQTRSGDWRVLLSEHPWRDPLTGDEKFIDFVLHGKTCQSLVVECKRARDTEWLFLREPTAGLQENRLITRARVVAKPENGRPQIDEWTNVPCIPGSPIAQYCVIRKNKQRSQELLERTAAEVVRATEELARQELAIFTKTGRRLSRVYTPIIVTTAQMFICDADYGKIDLESGEVAGVDITPVSLVRFMNTLSAVDAALSVTRLEGLAGQAERGVIVIQAKAFLSVLAKWDLGTLPHPLPTALFGD